MNRVFEYWVGSQASGKTYQLRRRSLALASRASIRRVIVLAPPGEWRDLADPCPLRSMGELLIDAPAPRPPILPSVEVGNPVGVESVVRTCGAWGDCAIIMDEAALWIPSQLTVESLRSRSPALFSALVRGRHLARSDGLERPLHLVIAAQYPRSVHHLVTDQARTIMVSRPAGELTQDWIRGNGGRAALMRSLELGEHQWTAIRGRDPRRG